MLMRKRWWLMGAVPAGTFILGLAETRPDRLIDMDSLFSTFMAFVCLLLVFCWYRSDARDFGYRTSWGMNTAMLVVTAIAVPWYLVRSRSGMQIPIALLSALGMLVLCGLSYSFGSALGQGL
jgi:hypothetical protein